MATKKTEPTKPKQPRIYERLVLNDASAKPGVALMERIAHARHPSEEDLAILDAWKPTLCIAVVQAGAR